MSLIAFITKMAVIPVTVIADTMAITAVIAIMAVIPCMTMVDLMATMALLNILNMMVSASMTFTILNILVTNAGYGHNGSNFNNSCNGYYGHKGLNGFKCCRSYNFSIGSSSRISSNDGNGNYVVLELMAKNV